jgi:integrase
LSPSTAEKVFTAAAGRAGIRKGVSFHSLRHYAGCRIMPGSSLRARWFLGISLE